MLFYSQQQKLFVFGFVKFLTKEKFHLVIKLRLDLLNQNY